MTAMTPGTYLRKRREAAGVSIDAIALTTETEPPVSARSRAEWLQLIEADRHPLSADVLDVLQQSIEFDEDVLYRLLAIHAGHAIDGPALCDVCACSDLDPCMDGDGTYCSWAGPTLCTQCVDRAGSAEASAE